MIRPWRRAGQPPAARVGKTPTPARAPSSHGSTTSLTREYYEALDAPAGKELVVFEESAHTPFLAEPERFHRELVG